MNTLQRYIARQVLVTLAVSVTVFSGVLLAGNAFKQLLDLLASHQVPTAQVVQQTFYLLPFVLTFSLPMGMMTTCLLVFGRLSADNEISAMRACGLSFWQLISPVLIIGFLLSLVCLQFNLQEAPVLKAAFREGLARLGLAYPTAFLEEGRFNGEFPGYLIYVGKTKRDVIRDVSIYQLDEHGNVIQNIRATHGRIESDLPSRRAIIHLNNVRSEVHDSDDPNNPQKIRPGITANDYEIALDLTQMLESGKGNKRNKDLMTINELIPAIFLLRQHGVDATPYVVRAHKQCAISFACLAFAMVGIPFGIRAHRRETSIGIALALALAFAYYFLVILAEALSNKPHFAPEILVWMPDIIFQILGIALLWRVSRVGAV